MRHTLQLPSPVEDAVVTLRFAPEPRCQAGSRIAKGEAFIGINGVHVMERPATIIAVVYHQETWALHYRYEDAQPSRHDGIFVKGGLH